MKRIFNGLRLKKFLPGGHRTLLSAKAANEIVDPLNALLNVRIVRSGATDKVEISDSGTIITLKDTGNISDTPPDTPPPPPEGDTTIATTNGDVRRVIIASTGKVYIGGPFTLVSGKARIGFAALSSGLELLPESWWFSIDDASVASSTFCAGISERSDGRIYVAGEGFSKINGLKVGRDGGALGLCGAEGLLETDGNVNSFADVGHDGVGDSECLSVSGSDKLLIASNATHWGPDDDVRSYGIAMLNTDGSFDLAFDAAAGGGLGGSGIIDRFLQHADRVYLAGGFGQYAGVTRGSIAKITVGGGLDEDFVPGTGGVGFDANVLGIARDAGGGIICGGNFHQFDGVTRNFLARLNGTTGAIDTTFNPVLSDAVRAVVIQGDGKIVIGGNFATVNGSTRKGLARLNTDGTLDSSFTSDVLDSFGGAGTVYDIAYQSAYGTFVVGGAFVSINGTARSNIARISSSGGVLGS